MVSIRCLIQMRSWWNFVRVCEHPEFTFCLRLHLHNNHVSTSHCTNEKNKYSLDQHDSMSQNRAGNTQIERVAVFHRQNALSGLLFIKANQRIWVLTDGYFLNSVGWFMMPHFGQLEDRSDSVVCFEPLLTHISEYECTRASRANGGSAEPESGCLL